MMHEERTMKKKWRRRLRDETEIRKREVGREIERK